MNFGLPYKGSKNTLAQGIVERLPSAGTFVDLFCGGCAVTHAAMLAGRWERFLINDICGAMPQLFLDAVRGKFRNETRWISHEEFNRLKDTDGYVRACWSFGNNGVDYLYSAALEPYKEALHYAVFFRDFELVRLRLPAVADEVEKRLKRLENRKDRRIEIGRAIVSALNAIPWQERERLIEHNALYQACRRGTEDGRLQSLERLERLESLESLESLEMSTKDYREVELPDDCVVYADPPYKGTRKYNNSVFDSEAFWEWCRRCPHPVYISEYSAPEDFIEVAAKSHTKSCAAKCSTKSIERLYCNQEPIQTTLF